jgi:hypothetical protein
MNTTAIAILLVPLFREHGPRETVLGRARRYQQHRDLAGMGEDGERVGGIDTRSQLLGIRFGEREEALVLLRMNKSPSAEVEDRRQPLEQRGETLEIVREVGHEGVEPGEFVDDGHGVGREDEIAQGRCVVVGHDLNLS